MKRIELLAKHRQASEAAVLQMNRKHVLGLQEEVQRIDKEMKMREKYLVFEKTLFYGRLDKIQQRQLTLGLIKSPISRTTPHSVQKRMQPRKVLRVMRKRPEAEIFLTLEPGRSTGVILPPVTKSLDNNSGKLTPLKSSKYAPSWLELPNGKEVQKRVSAHLLPSIEEKPEQEKFVHGPNNGKTMGQYLPPIDIVQSVNKPLAQHTGAMKESISSSSSKNSGGNLKETKLSGNGDIREGTKENVNSRQDNSEKGGRTNIEETEDEYDRLYQRDLNNDKESNGDRAIKDSTCETGDINGEKDGEISKGLTRLSLENESEQKNRLRTLSVVDTNQDVTTKDESLRPQSAPAPRKEKDHPTRDNLMVVVRDATEKE